MKLVDWMIVALDRSQDAVAFWGGASWVSCADLGKDYFDRNEAQQVLARLAPPEGCAGIAIWEYESDVKE